MPYFPERHLTKENGEWVDSPNYPLETLELEPGGLQRTITTVNGGVQTRWNLTETSTRQVVYTSVDGTEQLRWLQFDRFRCLEDRQKSIEEARMLMGTGVGLSVVLFITAVAFTLYVMKHDGDDTKGLDNDVRYCGCMLSAALCAGIIAPVQLAREHTNNANEGVADTEWKGKWRFEPPVSFAIIASAVPLAVAGLIMVCAQFTDSKRTQSGNDNNAYCCMGCVYLIGGFVCVITTSVAFHRIGDTPWAPDDTEVNSRQFQCGYGDKCYTHRYWCKWNNVKPVEPEPEPE